jgi:hypothetical protein
MDYAKVRKVFGNEVTQERLPQRATELKKRTTEYFKGFLCGSLFFSLWFSAAGVPV